MPAAARVSSDEASGRPQTAPCEEQPHEQQRPQTERRRSEKLISFDDTFDDSVSAAPPACEHLFSACVLSALSRAVVGCAD